MKTKILMALLAGTTLFAACKSGSTGHYEVTSSSADSATIGRSAADSVAIPKLIKTADIRFKVKSVEKTSTDISALTTQYQGMVMHHQMNSRAEKSNDVRVNSDSVMRVTALNISADMTVKVPSENLEEFMDKVAAMGLYVDQRKMDIEDRTLDYLSNKLKMNSRRDIIAQQKKGKVVIKHAADVLLLKDDIIDQQIDNKRVDEAVRYSMVNLNLYQSNIIKKEIIANDDPSAYGLPFFNRLGLALNNGWYIFKEIIIGCANLWTLIAIAIIIWLIIRRYRLKGGIVSDTSA
ncbi:DUF4349 domain-containing protein [Mucilaginibacter mali]|uniref:DUF4349 domain-containing protein n=1 Tax=Mucilaginibacter mali TaxID=2740462 RepID=A0A7D4UMD6_9SPHI|nr:DUF4349 domain-containing protein [Mucilaginibacter mali]QKJ30961.1 DUF4349 domain-containing protein [Mucilaginibacter mali]